MKLTRKQIIAAARQKAASLGDEVEISDDAVISADVKDYVRVPAFIFVRAPEGFENDDLVSRLTDEIYAKHDTDKGSETQDAIDNLIYDHVGMSKSASNVNNQGYEGQVKALIERLGPEEAEKVIREVLE